MATKRTRGCLAQGLDHQAPRLGHEHGVCLRSLAARLTLRPGIVKIRLCRRPIGLPVYDPDLSPLRRFRSSLLPCVAHHPTHHTPRMSMTTAASSITGHSDTAAKNENATNSGCGFLL